MKKLITLIVLLFSMTISAQDAFLQKDHEILEQEADKITQKYNAELSLTAKQQSLFQKKVEEFLIRREDIEANKSGKEKLDLLYSLQKVETAEMGNIITRPQLRLYKKIKKDIQPLDTVDIR